jgi:hypothetical protein
MFQGPGKASNTIAFLKNERTNIGLRQRIPRRKPGRPAAQNYHVVEPIVGGIHDDL